MIPRQDKADPDNDANDEADDETKTGGVTGGTLAQIKNSGRLVFVHGKNLHRCLPRTTGGTAPAVFPPEACHNAISPPRRPPPR